MVYRRYPAKTILSFSSLGMTYSPRIKAKEKTNETCLARNFQKKETPSSYWGAPILRHLHGWFFPARLVAKTHLLEPALPVSVWRSPRGLRCSLRRFFSRLTHQVLVNSPPKTWEQCIFFF